MNGRATAATRVALALVALVVLPACSESIDDPFVPVGAMRVYPIDPAQSLSTIGVDGVQAAEFRLSEARVVLEGTEIDLLGGTGTCEVVDTVLTNPTFDTTLPCALGIVVGETDSPAPLDVHVRLEMELVRAEPLLYDRNGDFDGDGFPNFVDSCPLIANPDQADANADGIGDACEVASPVDPLATAVDNDGDGVADSVDNCDFLPNPDQTDASPFPGAPYGIGAACPIQRATVYQNGSPALDIRVTVDDVEVNRGTATLVIVDFDNRDAVQCDWERGRCDLVEGGVQVCTETRTDIATFGCVG